MTNTNSKFHMAGTEGTGAYIVLLATELGRVGYRKLGGSARVRVEPADDTAAPALKSAFPASKWKQPGEGGQFRFSITTSGKGLEDALTTAVTALLCGAESVEVNPDLGQWEKDIVGPCRAAAKAHAGNSGADTSGDEEPVAEPGEPLSDERTRLMAEAKKLKVRGANGRWSLETLRRKIADAKK